MTAKYSPGSSEITDVTAQEDEHAQRSAQGTSKFFEAAKRAQQSAPGNQACQPL
jgi:hypothetical protein